MTTTDRIQIIEEFIDFCQAHLSIEELPKMTFIEDRSWVLARHSFGEYTNKDKALVMYIKNRNLADVLRTLAHELCHHRQNELGLLYPGAGKTGSPVENEANIVAGMILREFGKSHEMIYESLKTNLIKQLLKEDIKKKDEITPNKFVYHASNPIFRDNISKQGLIPKGKSETWLSDTKIDGKVIFAVNSDNKKDWWDSTYDDDIYQIDTTNLNNKWYNDPNFEVDKNRIITFEEIPLNAIKLIYKGTGESY